MAELQGLFTGLGAGLSQAGQTIGRALEVRGLMDARQEQTRSTEAIERLKLERLARNDRYDKAYKLVFETPGLDDETRRISFNQTMIPVLDEMMIPFPRLEAGQFSTRTAEKFAKQAQAIFRQYPDPHSEERETLLQSVLASMLENPQSAPAAKLIIEAAEQQRQGFVARMTDLYEKVARGTANDDELRVLANEELAVGTPGLAQGQGRSRERLALALAEAKRAGIARIDAEIKRRREAILTVPTASRAVQLMPGGATQEVVPAAPAEKELSAAQAAAKTFAGLLTANPGMSEQAAAIQAWRQHGDLPENMKSLVPPLVKAELEAEITKQAALEPGRIRVARETGAAVKEVEERVRRGRRIPADAASLLGLPQGMTIGQAEDSGLKVPEGPALAKLKEFKVFHDEGTEIIGELDILVAKTPEAVGRTGRIATLVGGLQAQAQNFARLAGIRVDASLQPRDYAETFRGIGITDAKMQSQIIALAFPLAVAAQGGSGGGGRLSDKDVEFQIRRIGAGARDPVAFRAVLAEVRSALTRSFNRMVETETGRAPAATSAGGKERLSDGGEITILRRRPVR